MDLTGTKSKLINQCIQTLENKLHALDKELNLLQESANEETKNSAGDKYETGRAMVMLEKEKLAGQKEQIFQQIKPLKSIDEGKEFKKVEHGAVVMTSGSNYFISSGIGQVEVEGISFLVISAMAPLAQVMIGKGEGETFSFNRNTFEIQKIV